MYYQIIFIQRYSLQNFIFYYVQKCTIESIFIQHKFNYKFIIIKSIFIQHNANTKTHCWLCAKCTIQIPFIQRKAVTKLVFYYVHNAPSKLLSFNIISLANTFYYVRNAPSKFFSFNMISYRKHIFIMCEMPHRNYFHST